MNRTLVFGDIHGYSQELKKLLALVQMDESDQGIFLGDYTDRGPDTPGVIQTLIDLPGNHVFLKGNHDTWLYDWLNMGVKNPIFYDAEAVIDQYINSGLDWKAHREFLFKTRSYYEKDGRVFVHGGYTSSHGIGHEHYESNYYWDRTLVEIVIASQEMPAKLKHHREVFVGHSPTINYEFKSNGRVGNKKEGHPGITTPINKFNFWMMDTGICFGGKLTCMDVETKKIWQVAVE